MEFYDFFASYMEQWVWMEWLPALFIAYSLSGFLIFNILSLFRSFNDSEIMAGSASIFLGRWVRNFYLWLVHPAWVLLVRLNIPPLAVTTLSIYLAVAAGISISQGYFALAGVLIIWSFTCDLLDGRLARHRNQTSELGAFLDSSLDRYSEAFLFTGLCWFYRESWVLFPTLLAFSGSQIFSYLRSKAESLGKDPYRRGMQRAERSTYICIAVILSPLADLLLFKNSDLPEMFLTAVCMIFLAVVSNIYALLRLLHVAKQFGKQQVFNNFHHGVIAAVLATGVDFLFFFNFLLVVKLNPVLATFLACILGAVVNFIYNRWITFKNNERILRQFGKYGLISAISAVLNSSGVAVFLLLSTEYVFLVWVVVRVLVFATWNFPLHKFYVFKGRVDETPQVESVNY